MRPFRIHSGLALLMLVLLLAISHGIIQTTLFHERDVRATSALAKGLTTRELSLSLNARNIKLDPAHRLDSIKAINTVYTEWQQMQTQIDTGTYSSNPQVQESVQVAIPHYLILDTTFGVILNKDSGPSAVDIDRELLIILAHDTPYLSAMDQASSTLNTDVEAYVRRVQWIEGATFLLSLTVLAYGSLFAVRPALEELNALLAQQQEHLPANVTPFPTKERTHAD